MLLLRWTHCQKRTQSRSTRVCFRKNQVAFRLFDRLSEVSNGVRHLEAGKSTLARKEFSDEFPFDECVPGS